MVADMVAGTVADGRHLQNCILHLGLERVEEVERCLPKTECGNHWSSKLAAARWYIVGVAYLAD